MLTLHVNITKLFCRLDSIIVLLTTTCLYASQKGTVKHLTIILVYSQYTVFPIVNFQWKIWEFSFSPTEFSSVGISKYNMIVVGFSFPTIDALSIHVISYKDLWMKHTSNVLAWNCTLTIYPFNANYLGQNLDAVKARRSTV